MNADADCISVAECGTAGVNAACALFERNVGEFGDDDFDVEAEGGEFCCHAGGDVAVECVFAEAAVGRAFARSIGAVAGVKNDCHCAAGFVSCSSSDSGGKDTKGFRETRIFATFAVTEKLKDRRR